MQQILTVGNTVLTATIHLEDLTVGQRWLSPSRVITEDDVTDFADLTGDHTPLHSELSASNPASPFGRPVVHGLLGLSVLAGLSSEHPRVKTLALVRIGNWDFRRPIYFGDTVRVETEVVSIEPCGRRAGRVRWLRRLVGSQGQLLQEGTVETLVAARNARARGEAVPGPSVSDQVPREAAAVRSLAGPAALSEIPATMRHPR